MAAITAFVAIASVCVVGLCWWLVTYYLARQKRQTPLRRSTAGPDCERPHQEFNALIPELYQSGPGTQRAVGISLNMAAAMFRSVYPNERAFELVSPAEQQAFLRRLDEAEQRFVDKEQPEAGVAVTLFKCWLSSIAKQDWQTAAELKRHLDHFSCQTLNLTAEAMNRTASSGHS